MAAVLNAVGNAECGHRVLPITDTVPHESDSEQNLTLFICSDPSGRWCLRACACTEATCNPVPRSVHDLYKRWKKCIQFFVLTITQ
jgi:hypothetical protein